jgi:hypothetical protein
MGVRDRAAYTVLMYDSVVSASDLSPAAYWTMPAFGAVAGFPENERQRAEVSQPALREIDADEGRQQQLVRMNDQAGNDMHDTINGRLKF